MIWHVISRTLWCAIIAAALSQVAPKVASGLDDTMTTLTQAIAP